MSKKIVVLLASARKDGNSDILCGEFIKGAEEAGHEVKKIYLTDMNINYCLGCGVCRGKGGCVYKDDMSGILEKIFICNVLVLATPVYFYSMNAQMKTFIDRTFARYSEMKNKEIYIIVTGGADEEHYLDTAVEGLRGFIGCLPGVKEKGVIYGINAGEAGTIKNTPAIQEAYKMGKTI
jgi:multimeric flavodoxin WrbA